MLKIVAALEVAIALGVFFIGYLLLRRRLSRAGLIAAVVVGLCALFVSLSVSDAAQPSRSITLTALNACNSEAESAELTLSRVEVNGSSATLPTPISGRWTLSENQWRWFVPGDERRDDGQTDQLTFSFNVLNEVELLFAGNQWKGMVRLELDGQQTVLDTYRPDSESVRFALPPCAPALASRAAVISVTAFAVCLLCLCAVGFVLALLGQWLWPRLYARLARHALFQKLSGYQFLFEELVKRDFKKKYKRTVLGMAWSVLSPLLNLLVMRLVFTQFFGRTVPHYTTYLFCGNLVFSYFNESTSQGMTSLRDNAGIFTKVNVPKYLFLFSKSVQTLINFALTLMVLFIFCVLDQITFTWKFVLLLYPIIMLLLFNIGVGLILSAMFVFFKDIQYLWSVFTMLLMYMSAIFYSIDSYTPMGQNLFLLNPVYLFIRYFRKIIIEATIPSPWFHLLMLADVVIVLAAGYRMYKKNNTKFLYYV